MRTRVRSSQRSGEGDPLPIREFTARVLATSFSDLPLVLSDFAWSYEKGDLNHWCDLLNFFEGLLQQHVAGRADLHLRGADEGEAPCPPLPVPQLLQILRCTGIILENCSNKHAYGSVEVLRRGELGVGFWIGGGPLAGAPTTGGRRGEGQGVSLPPPPR